MATKAPEIRTRSLLGLALLLLGAILLFGGRQSDKELSNYTFASEPVDVTGFDTTDVDPKRIPQRIIVPALTIDLPVAVSNAVWGFWEVHEDKANWGAGSGLPGDSGNQVIFAHAREGLFLPLRGIKEGMDIYVLTGNGWNSYSASEIKEVFPNDITVIAPSSDERLTLYTCSGFGDSKRLIVVAKPQL